jgi:FkbM family methyltransferase
MIDVGGHHGASAIPFAKEGWNVHSFEPDTSNRNVLEENVAKTNLQDKIFIHPVALGAKSGKLPLYRSPVSAGISGLLNFHTTHTEAEIVDVVTLNDFLEKENISNIDFLKIDAEGYDYLVLQGINLEKYSPKVIICEYEDKKSKKLNYTFKDMVGYLNQNGYKCIYSEWQPIEEYGSSHSWSRFTINSKDIDSETSWGNIISVPEEYFTDLCKFLKVKN